MATLKASISMQIDQESLKLCNEIRAFGFSYADIFKAGLKTFNLEEIAAKMSKNAHELAGPKPQ